MEQRAYSQSPKSLRASRAGRAQVCVHAHICIQNTTCLPCKKIVRRNGGSRTGACACTYVYRISVSVVYRCACIYIYVYLSLVCVHIHVCIESLSLHTHTHNLSCLPVCVGVRGCMRASSCMHARERERERERSIGNNLRACMYLSACLINTSHTLRIASWS